jgi:hypothetical protein
MEKASKWLVVAIVSSVIGFISFYGGLIFGASMGSNYPSGPNIYLPIGILLLMLALFSSIYSLTLTWGKSTPTKKVSKSDRVLMTIFNPIVFLIGCVCYFAIIITFNLD